jgi:hypothetical protein
MADISDQYLDLLQQKKAFANLATAMADGSPQVTPVWFDYKDGVVRVNTAKGRVKARILKAGSPVALAIRRRRAYRLAGQKISRQGQVSVPPAW